MPLTAEARAEKNRRNAAGSSGPKSVGGKAASRANALRHGLRAEALALPREDPAEVAARSEAWNDYYRPNSPAAQHLVNECVAATLLSERCQRFHAAALSRQIRNAERDWDARREDSVEALAVLIETDPAQAVHRLKQSAHGLRWLIEVWERLRAALDETGHWSPFEIDEAVRLQGFRPEPANLKTCPPAWVTRLYALLCQESPPDAQIRLLFEARNLPDSFGRQFRADAYPERDDCRRLLRDRVAEELERLRLDEESLRAFDEPDRSESGDRALILHDPTSARLFLRYLSEARCSFHRSYAALLTTLEHDAAPDGDSAPVSEPEAEAPTPSNSEPTPPEPVSPNEANSAASSSELETCDASPRIAGQRNAPRNDSTDLDRRRQPSKAGQSARRTRTKREV